MTKEDFADIAPFEDSEFKENMASLVKEPGFKHAVTYVLPMVDYPAFVKQLQTIDSKDSFQRNIMAPFLEMLANKTSAGLSIDGVEHAPVDEPRTFISNHRDIVLDAAFLNISLMRDGYRASEIALGDNLLIYEWIERLVKLNKGFIVKRNLQVREAYEAAKKLSAYIHYCIEDKNESVWIAQREGRAKDSDDRTQESVIKMFALAGGDNPLKSIKSLNICPTTISYEYDPNDFLKATEYLLKRNNPDHVKSQQDDLLAMETGLLGYKGRIHYHLSPVINDEIDKLGEISDRNKLITEICAIIDRSIHLGYKIYPSNYIAYDRLNATNRFSYKYPPKEAVEFARYLDGQLAKVRVDNLTDDDKEYMMHMMLKMYANPLRNKLIAQGKEA